MGQGTGGEAVEGLVVVDKPAGMTSHDVVARLRRIYGLRRVGHAGTLDPGAPGVLLVALGRATRLLRFLAETGKVYRGEVAFGVATDTLDAAGAETARQTMPGLTRADLEAVLPRFLGTIAQIPPMVSAIKLDGRRLHERARAGEVVERAPRGWGRSATPAGPTPTPGRPGAWPTASSSPPPPSARPAPMPAPWPSSVPTAGCWPSTRRAGRRPARWSSWPAVERGVERAD